ncbi:hypothetical protein, partial [Listeria monocytogenes]|uniref:hypothetical protein n=1 Tax=Listeria monocytogenes TaxID=1639 RepID=UPI001F1C1EA8
ALRLPVRLYVSLLFVFFFVQFTRWKGGGGERGGEEEEKGRKRKRGGKGGKKGEKGGEIKMKKDEFGA